MTAGETPRQVRITIGSAFRIALAAFGAVAVLIVLDQSRGVIEWLVTAAVIAVLLHGPVLMLAQQVHRGVAVALVGTLALVALAALVYGVANAALGQYEILQRAAPAAAEDFEQSSRFGELARRVRLVERTRDAVDAIPTALFGPPATAAQTAAERLGEFVLVATLVVFILVGYDRFARRFVDLTHLAARRWRPGVALWPGAIEGARTARRAVGRAGVLGLLAGVVAGVVGLPAPVVLGLWMAWWRLLPVLGLALGYTPLVLLLVTGHPAWVTALALGAMAGGELAAYRLSRGAFLRASGAPVAFVSAAAFAAGFESAGSVGAVVTVVLAHLAIGILRALSVPGAGSRVDGSQ